MRTSGSVQGGKSHRMGAVTPPPSLKLLKNIGVRSDPTTVVTKHNKASNLNKWAKSKKIETCVYSEIHILLRQKMTKYCWYLAGGKHQTDLTKMFSVLLDSEIFLEF